LIGTGKRVYYLVVERAEAIHCYDILMKSSIRTLVASIWS
jgi:hypothetical protein